MIVSLNEIEATVGKAANAAGFCWGLAEEAGQAARWLAGHGLAWLEPMLAQLEQGITEGSGPELRLAERRLQPGAGARLLDPLVGGVLLSDLADRLPGSPEDLSIGPVARPVLLLPFIARVARRQDVAVQVSWPGTNLLIGPGGVAVSPGATLDKPTVDEVLCRANPGPPPRLPRPRPGGREADDRLWARLGALAARTLVPATETSRVAGAGAGLSDND